MKKLIYLWAVIACCSCSSQGVTTEKYQDTRDEVVNVHDKFVPVDLEEALLGGNNILYVFDDYLLIVDPATTDKVISVFDKQTFAYVKGFANRGTGPKEITHVGALGLDEANRRFFMSDHGKQKIFCCDLDSVLADSLYFPLKTISMKKKQFPSEYVYVSDTLCIGRVITPTGANSYSPATAKWNMLTGAITPMPYVHPAIKNKRMVCSASPEHKLYVECHTYHDLLTLCDLDGNLICNVYGPAWDPEPVKKIHYFSEPVFRKDQFIVAYSGGANSGDSYYPTKFMVFDLEGNYLKTLDLGRMIVRYCYDKDNDRLILSLNDADQFGYLDLKDLI